MDFRKLFLYCALVIVALALWNVWQREHPSTTAAPATVNNNANIPTATNNNSNGVPNVPSGTVPSSAQINKASANTSDYITVTTDVLKILIDKKGGDIVQSSLLAYPQELNNPAPFVLLNNDPQQLYITQSGLTGADGPDTPQQGQATYSSNTNSYQLENGQDKLTVNLNWQNTQGLQVTKTYTFYRGKYAIDLNYTLHNASNKPWTVHSYAQTQRVEPASQSSMFHYGTFTGVALSSPEEHYQKFKFADLTDTPINQNITNGWLAMVQHYFLSAWVPPLGQDYHYYSNQGNNNVFTVGMIGPAITVVPQQTASTGLKFYNGPAIAENLDTVAPHLSMTIDYGWLWFISSFLFWIMTYIHKVVGNWGWSIIILTLLIKAVFYQLSAKSYRSMGHMRRLQPKMQQIKERYGDDRQKVSQAIMELYRKEKVNPLSGCIPILIQIPFFIALYYMIIESVELRHAPFIFWIRDLSVADPYYILPVIMGVLMFLQQKLNPPAPDPMQQKVMMFLPVIFTIFFLNFPAGLVLYWITNTAVGALQQWWMLRQVNKEEGKAKNKKDKIEKNSSR